MKYLLCVLLLLSVVACKDDKPKRPSAPVVVQPDPVVVVSPIDPVEPVDPIDPDPVVITPPGPPQKDLITVSIKCVYPTGQIKHYKDADEVITINPKRGHFFKREKIVMGRPYLSVYKFHRGLSEYVNCVDLKKSIEIERELEVELKSYSVKCGSNSYWLNESDMKKKQCKMSAYSYKGKNYGLCAVLPSPLPPMTKCEDSRPIRY